MSNVVLLTQRIAQLEAEQQQLRAEQARLEAEKQQADARCDAYADENAELRQQLQEKELEYKLLIERVFGPKSERFKEDPNQLGLNFGDVDQIDDAIAGIQQAEDELEIEVSGHKLGRKSRREKLPEHLPRQVVTIDLPEAEKEGLTCIGYDSTETLVFSPPKLSVIETRYPKYIDPANSEAGVKQAERAAGLVSGNRYDTGVAAQIVTAKYGYHLPIYRQQDMFAGSGWSPARSTLLNILVSAALLIRPLIEYFREQVRGDAVETCYQGTLLGDCYGANTGITLRSSGQISFAACVAHARRKVRDARDNHPRHAIQLLSMLRELYDIEDRGQSMTLEDRLELRQTEARAHRPAGALTH